MTEKYYILSDEKPLLEAKIQEMVEQEKKQTIEKALANSQGETFHDNPANEDIELQQQMLSSRGKELFTLLREATILSVEDLQNRVEDGIIRMGKIIEIEENGETYSIEIGGFRKTGNRISYTSPLAIALIGKEVGDKINFTHNSKTRVLSIEGVKNI